ncbi:hypothetical protein APR09_001185 [Nocardia amikacinitolerans]|nr:hypothetical protein [Nocardia amikacinitolerans]
MFWGRALDATEEKLNPASSRVYRRLRLPDSQVRLLLQATADTKVSKARVHIDIETDEVEAEVRRLAALRPDARRARALRLSRDERDHLYRLANRPIPTGTASHVHPARVRTDTVPSRGCEPSQEGETMSKEFGGKKFRPPEDAQKPNRQSLAEAKAAFAEFDRRAGRQRYRYHEEESVPPGAGALALMPRRVYGDRSVDKWPGSADERAALQVRAETERRRQQRIRIALQWADIPAATRAGYGEAGVWELARRNASFAGDVDELADHLNAAGLPARPGADWDRRAVSEVIGLLWPQEHAGSWPRGELGTYPGYLGPLRDKPGFITQFSVTAPYRGQYRCIRCGAQWPAGWPDAGDGSRDFQCPDCLTPGGGTGTRDTEHSIIDLHWMMDRFAPRPVGPCSTCGAARELVPRGYSGPERVLHWTCGLGDALRRDEHFMASLERAEWESTAAHYAYWLAVDMLRLAYYSGEVTDLPVGATYVARDGSDERWVYRPGGWERCAGETTTRTGR